MKNWIALLIILLMGIGIYLYYNPQILSGIKLPTFSKISTLDLIEEPEKYYNKSVAIVAYPTTLLDTKFYPEFRYEIAEKNEEGKLVSMMVKYDYFYCYKCEITGAVERIKVCECQSDYYYGTDRIVPIEKCENPPENLRLLYKDWFCKPNSERYIYYLNVTKVKALD